MCGVIGLVSERHRADLGAVAAELLKTLEYRGYDSTGAAFQGEGRTVDLRKGVGAPSVLVDTLGIVGLSGSILCGQVRWATFGSVDEANAQPHEVRCKTHLYGAHNGNVTNCDDLKLWLASEGHLVLSDNDGEMLVHTIEHYFASELHAAATAANVEPDALPGAQRRHCMRAALVAAASRLQGSYAAIVVDPVSRCAWALKQGSSLYFGFGRDANGGDFGLASSDLSAVLKLTRVLVPMTEGEYLEFDASSHRLYALRVRPGADPEQELGRQPLRSRLQAKDAALLAPFESFMEQEIAAQEETCRRIQTLFSGGSDALRKLRPWLPSRQASEAEAALPSLHERLRALRDEVDDERIRARFYELVTLPSWLGLVARVPPELRRELSEAPLGQLIERLASLESGLLADLLKMARNAEERFSVRLLDAIVEAEELADFGAATRAFVAACRACRERGGRILVVCCGSSFHAALGGAVFFNEIAHAELVPLLAGDFRARYAASLRPDDLVVAVSQSGETKDLIDVMNHVIASGLPIRRIAIVNNVSSTLGQEKCDTVLPLRCGPEIAVPATKSYLNQLAMLYCLALELERAQLAELPDRTQHAQRAAALAQRDERLRQLPLLIRETLVATEHEVEHAAKLLYLKPSLHILATRLLAIAKEGALKIREVVLNHSEGFEASEFKHGPNTILGVNTIFGVDAVLRFFRAFAQRSDEALRLATQRGLDAQEARRLIHVLADAALSPTSTPFSLVGGARELFEQLMAKGDLHHELHEDYPLLFVTGPNETDVQLTVSQVNTHKIRGATCIMIAEEHAALRQAVSRPPADNPNYRWVYITLPRTDDNLMLLFSATVVLQRLALRMSLLKRDLLDKLGFEHHGVHPDVPKNVSKSITVD